LSLAQLTVGQSKPDTQVVVTVATALIRFALTGLRRRRKASSWRQLRIFPSRGYSAAAVDSLSRSSRKSASAATLEPWHSPLAARSAPAAHVANARPAAAVTSKPDTVAVGPGAAPSSRAGVSLSISRGGCVCDRGRACCGPRARARSERTGLDR
jgi:hypothetical protein